MVAWMCCGLSQSSVMPTPIREVPSPPRGPGVRIHRSNSAIKTIAQMEATDRHGSRFRAALLLQGEGDRRPGLQCDWPWAGLGGSVGGARENESTLRKRPAPTPCVFLTATSLQESPMWFKLRHPGSKGQRLQPAMGRVPRCVPVERELLGERRSRSISTMLGFL